MFHWALELVRMPVVMTARDTDEEESLYVQDDDDALMQIEEYGLEALFAENTEHPGTNERGVENTGGTPEGRADIPHRGDSRVYY